MALWRSAPAAFRSLHVTKSVAEIRLSSCLRSAAGGSEIFRRSSSPGGNGPPEQHRMQLRACRCSTMHVRLQSGESFRRAGGDVGSSDTMGPVAAANRLFSNLQYPHGREGCPCGGDMGPARGSTKNLFRWGKAGREPLVWRKPLR